MDSLLPALESPYEAIYRSLHEVREVFHREGRISDSNAKLDETVKLLAVHFAFEKEIISKQGYEDLFLRATFKVQRLKELFEVVAATDIFSNAQVGSIFGTRPTIAFDQGDEPIAFELFKAAGHAFNAHGRGIANIDALNEAFGHHVRDNFRSHIEDAQYMTPPEVVEFMVKMAAWEILKGNTLSCESFVMADPSCGVGTFLTSWRKEFERLTSITNSLPRLLTVGQDKVERMARLSSVNLIFAQQKEGFVSIGNSLIDGSPLSQFDGQVDLILTNPPFGAKFSSAEIAKKGQKSTQIFASLPRNTLAQVDSELLFIDRYLSLLKPGGLCLAVVPDGVVSAKGIPAVLRQQLLRRGTLKAVVELPAVTFAQAGTRTKTAVIMFQKMPMKIGARSKVFFAEANDIGFEVSKRKGVPIKRSVGTNQLPGILNAYAKGESCEEDKIGRQITAVWRELDPAAYPAWTPRQFKYGEDRLKDCANGDSASLRPLADFVEPRAKRKSVSYRDDKYFISVLHIIGEGILDVEGVKKYKPITPGIPLKSGEVIISRLNPRIPRVLVVPDLGKPLLCSTEFEVLSPKVGVSPYGLSYLLLHPMVQEQVQALTAGTSASHSRVKPEGIRAIQMPWPNAAGKEDFEKKIHSYETAVRGLLKALLEIHELREDK
jgi:type I restriction-modification system DNA methylase subunit